MLALEYWLWPPTFVSGGTSCLQLDPEEAWQFCGLLSQEMASRAPMLLLLLLLPSCPEGCPAACHCYSATVECGALRLRVIPQGIPPGTQVGSISQASGLKYPRVHVGGWVGATPESRRLCHGVSISLPWPTDAVPAGQQHHAPRARYAGSTLLLAPSLPAQQ